MRPTLPTLLALVGACAVPDGGSATPASTATDEDTEGGGAVTPTAPPCPPEAARHRPLRRWTRWQHQRAVEDLLGEPVPLDDLLPPDGGGWEGLADGQALGAVQVEAWHAAAVRASERLVLGQRTSAEVESMDIHAAAYAWGDGRAGRLIEGTAEAPVRVDGFVLPAPAPGRYRLELVAEWVGGWEASDGPLPQLLWHLPSGATPGRNMTEPTEALRPLAWEVNLDGPTDAALELITSDRYTGVALDRLALVGPLDAPLGAASAAWKRTIGCSNADADPRACTLDALRRLARRAWRGPVSAEAEADLAALVDAVLAEGGDIEEAVRLGVQAVLLSTSFLFFADDVRDLSEPRTTTPHERAVRLALLLWGSVPDEPLLACAEDGGLADDDDPCGLGAQVERMIAAPETARAVEDLARQWLGLDALAGYRTTAGAPAEDEAIVASMRAAVVARVRDAWSQDRPALHLLTAPEAWADATLAPLYGRRAPGSELQRLTDLEDRPGLLGEPAILALTSNPDRTSPVRRGAWVLARLLCDPPQPPPDGIPALPGEEAIQGDLASLLAAHSASPSCRGCHMELDPLGLAMEGFDRAGRSRDTYPDGSPVDATGELPDGTILDGLPGLASFLGGDPRTARCIAAHVGTWGHALPADDLDACEAARLDAAAGSLRDLVRTVATSTSITHVSPPEAP